MNQLKHFATVGWLIVGILMGVLPYFHNGVFFEQGHLIVDLVLLSLLVLWFVWLGAVAILQRRREPGGKRIGKQSSLSSGWSTPINRYDIAFGIYVLIYVIGALHAANLVGSIEVALDAVALLCPYVLFRSRIQDAIASGWVLLGLALSSVSLNFVGMANAWGQLQFPSAFATQPNIQVSSVFQYHNTYAAFVSAMALGLLVYVTLQMRPATWLDKSLVTVYVAIASLNIAGLIFSGSRGALLLWLIVVVLTIVGLRDVCGKNFLRSRFIAVFYLACIGAVAGYPFLHKGLAHGNATYGWTGILLTLVVPAILYWVFALVAAKSKWRILQGNRQMEKLIGLGVVIAVIGGAVKLHSLLTKLASYHVHQMSVVQRFIFWKDGLKIFAQNPVLGMGGDAWMSMFFKVQSYPYYSTRVHSFLINTLLEVGIVGFLALAFAVWPLIRSVVWPVRLPSPTEGSSEGNQVGANTTTTTLFSTRDAMARRALTTVALMLFVHAFMDWDMPFLFIEMIFVMGIGAGVTSHAVARIRQAGASTSSASGQEYDRDRIHTRATRVFGVVAIPTVILSVVGLLTSIQMVRAENVSSQAGAATTLGQRTQLYNQAHQMIPFDPSYLLAGANALLSANVSPSGQLPPNIAQQALSMYQQGVRLDGYNASVQSTAAQLASQLGQYQTAAQYALNAYNDAPFEPNYVSLAMNAEAQYGLKSVTSNPTAAILAFQEVQTLLGQYQQRDKIVQALPSYLPPSNPYQLDQFAYNSLAVSFLAFHHPQQAIQLASAAVNANDPHTSGTAKLITMFAEQQLGQVGATNSINQFIRLNPAMQDNYEVLMNLQNLH